MKAFKYLFTILSCLIGFTVNAQTEKINYADKIKGQFVLENSTCAGFEFKDKHTVLWRNEIQCMHPDTLATYWIDRKTFVTKDKKRKNQDCPPRNWIYKVEYFNGSTLKLKGIWTGWGEFTTQQITLNKNE